IPRVSSHSGTWHLHASLARRGACPTDGDAMRSCPITWCRSVSDGAGGWSGHRGAQTRRFRPRTTTRGVTAMAETKRMTVEQVVSYLLEEEGLDFLRGSLTWVVQGLMEAGVAQLIAAARRG